MHTAIYLSNRTPRAALQNGTPYKALYGKDAYLGHLRVIGARAFVHEDTHQEAGVPCLGRTARWIQHGQQVVLDLQQRDETCTVESKCCLH